DGATSLIFLIPALRRLRGIGHFAGPSQSLIFSTTNACTRPVLSPTATRGRVGCVSIADMGASIVNTATSDASATAAILTSFACVPITRYFSLGLAPMAQTRPCLHHSQA